MPYEKTPTLLSVVSGAYEEAQRRGWVQATPECLLLAMLRDQMCAGSRALERCGVDILLLFNAVDAQMSLARPSRPTQQGATPPADIHLSAQAQAVLNKLAPVTVQGEKGETATYVGTDSLVMALLSSETHAPLSYHALRVTQVTPVDLVGAAIGLMGEAGGDGAPLGEYAFAFAKPEPPQEAALPSGTRVRFNTHIFERPEVYNRYLPAIQRAEGTIFSSFRGEFGPVTYTVEFKPGLALLGGVLLGVEPVLREDFDVIELPTEAPQEPEPEPVPTGTIRPLPFRLGTHVRFSERVLDRQDWYGGLRENLPGREGVIVDVVPWPNGDPVYVVEVSGLPVSAGHWDFDQKVHAYGADLDVIEDAPTSLVEQMAVPMNPIAPPPVIETPNPPYLRPRPPLPVPTDKTESGFPWECAHCGALYTIIMRPVPIQRPTAKLR